MLVLPENHLCTMARQEMRLMDSFTPICDSYLDQESAHLPVDGDHLVFLFQLYHATV